MPTVYLNIGSNKGHRTALIERAVALISEVLPDAALCRSSFIETEAWGFESKNRFLNLGLSLGFSCNVNAEELLKVFQRIEKSISPDSHRNADGTYRDRCVDIDIIAIDTMNIELPNLRVPHPRAGLRDFVLIPLRELAPTDVVDFVLRHSQM